MTKYAALTRSVIEVDGEIKNLYNHYILNLGARPGDSGGIITTSDARLVAIACLVRGSARTLLVEPRNQQ